MPDGHFQHKLWRDLKELWVIAVGLEEQRQDIEAPVRSLPALLNADLQAKQVWGLDIPANHLLFKHSGQVVAQH